MAISIGKKEIWDYWAPRYEKLWSQYFALGPGRALIHRHLASTDLQPNRILDVGCGVGQLVAELAQKWPEAKIIGLDYSPGMIEKARQMYNAPNVEYRMGSLENLEDQAPFDLVTSTHSFPYFPDKEKAARQMRRLLRSGGRALILQANQNNWYDAFWLIFVKLTVSQAQYLSVPQLKSVLASAGFSIGETKPIRTAFFIPSVYMVEAINQAKGQPLEPHFYENREYQPG